jgi:hypothetical protein
MIGRTKIIVGISSVVGTILAAGVIAKAADCIKRKWFVQGYETGHFVGSMDSDIAVVKKCDNALKTASELRKENTVLAEKYDNLCDEYDELEREYSELCDEYYES